VVHEHRFGVEPQQSVQLVGDRRQSVIPVDQHDVVLRADDPARRLFAQVDGGPAR
jgi:hypothetical protein